MAQAMAQEEIGGMLSYIVEHMVTKDEFTEGLNSLRSEFKADLFGLQTQVNSIETQVREMKHDRLGVRVADLEEKIFDKSR